MGFRRLPNLRDILTSSTISYPPKLTTDAKPSLHIPVCTRLGKCTYCPKIRKAEQITSVHTKQVFKCKSLPPKHKVTCELSNVIYIINCNKCGLQYIGETKRPFRNRMYEHQNSVQKFQPEKSTPVSRHFTQKNHSVKNMEFTSFNGWGIQQAQMPPQGAEAKNYIIFGHSLHSILQESICLYEAMPSHGINYPDAPFSLYTF